MTTSRPVFPIHLVNIPTLLIKPAPQQTKGIDPLTFPSRLSLPWERPAYTQIFPFRGSKTSVNMPTWLADMFAAESVVKVLAALFYQGRTRRRLRPYTYIDLAYRTGLCRNTIAWCLAQIAQTTLMRKESQKNEPYWQMVGKAHHRYKKRCKRNRRTSHLNWTVIKKTNQQEKRQLKAWARAQKKQQKMEKLEYIKTLTLKIPSPTPLNSPPPFLKSEKENYPQHTSKLKILEDLFIENKIRSYKIDGDMRCRSFIKRSLISINPQDLRQAVSLFAQNTFLMDANAHGWLVARANALRAQGKDPWTHGKQLNRYQEWCPSMTWFVRNISKILRGDYQLKISPSSNKPEMRDTPEAGPSSLSSPPLVNSLNETKKIALDAENTPQHHVQKDRRALHLGQTHWQGLDPQARQHLEATFIHAIRQGQTSLSPQTNMHDPLFKIIKEVMLFTWLGDRIMEDNSSTKET